MKALAVICIGIFTLSAQAETALSQLMWARTGGPVGGDVTALVMDDEGRLFAGTRLGGIYRSLDGGDRWSRLEPELLFRGVWDLATNASGDLFAATSVGVYRSTDGGDSWTTHAPGHQFVETVVINNDNVVFAGTRGGVFHSQDNGETWLGANTGLTDTFVQALSVTDEGNLFAGTQGGIFFSNDGDNWEARNEGLLSLNTIEVFPLRSDTVFAGTFDGLFRSIDGGQNWTRHIPFDLFRSIVRSESGILYGGASGTFYRSGDDGETWSQLHSDEITFALFDEVILDAGDNLLAGTYEDGVLRSSDGGETWSSANDNLTATDIVSLAVNSEGEVFAAGGDGVHKTTDGGQSWTRLANGLPTRNVEALNIGSDDRLFASTNGNGLHVSYNGGDTWQAADGSLTSQSIRSVAQSTNGDVFAGDTQGMVFKSVNGGDTWQLLDAGIPSTTVQVLAANGDLVLAGTSQNGVFRSTDGGGTWSEANTGLPPSYDVTGFLFQTDGSILAAMFGGVFRSADGGVSWEATGNVPTSGVKGIAADSKGNLYIASRGGGIAVSSDNAQTWTSNNDGFLHLDAAAVLVDGNDRVYGGTRGGGVFAAQAVATATEDLTDPDLDEFALDQSYPNPFSHHASIIYRLPESAAVEVRIVDILGRTVRILVSGNQTAGDHIVVWDGTDATGAPVVSGLYLYRIEAGTHVRTRGMLFAAP